MANQLRVEIQFTRAQIQTILNDSTVQFIDVTADYEYLGGGVWQMEAFAEGVSNNLGAAPSGKIAGCIKPCPAP